MMTAGRRLWTTKDRFINPQEQGNGKEIDLWIGPAGRPKCFSRAGFYRPI
jgi:hypothetical protein